MPRLGFEMIHIKATFTVLYRFVVHYLLVYENIILYIFLKLILKGFFNQFAGGLKNKIKNPIHP
jgi:hypothetical protein